MNISNETKKDIEEIMKEVVTDYRDSDRDYDDYCKHCNSSENDEGHITHRNACLVNKAQKILNDLKKV